MHRVNVRAESLYGDRAGAREEPDRPDRGTPPSHTLYHERQMMISPMRDEDAVDPGRRVTEE
jgi:hypothetical protein